MMRWKLWYTKTSRSPTSLVCTPSPSGFSRTGVDVGRETIKRGPRKRSIAGKDFHLDEEIRYIQRWAAEYDGRLVAVGPLVLFSTDTGDAWLLDPADLLAVRLARDGQPEDIYFEETDARFAIEWRGNYRIDGAAFTYNDNDTGRVLTILGYPTVRLAQLISEHFK